MPRASEARYRAPVQIHPTRASSELVWAGVLAMGIGLVLRAPFIVGNGAALLIGVLVARAVTEVGVARVRAAGFEMLWSEQERVRRVARGSRFSLIAEIRNRDTRATRYDQLRVVAAPELEVSVEPSSAEVPAGGRLEVRLDVTAPRVGRHGIHGLSLEVLGSPGLFEVPLTFANPQAVEVLPAPFAPALRSARGGRSRMSAPDGRPGPLAGEGVELRELREHRPGDPFKRIAWKASARRGKLLVTENEIEERDVVWVLVDASVENWAGPPGQSPLDVALDEAAAIVEQHLARGDRVGLALFGTRILTWLTPNRGPKHAANLMAALAFDAGCADGDRSDWDESEVAAHVLEHLRPLDPSAVMHVHKSDLDRIARRAERYLKRAPLSPPRPRGGTSRERVLRHYLASFGIQAPPRMEPERAQSELRIAGALKKLGREKRRSSIVYVWARPPDALLSHALLEAFEKFPKRRTELRFCAMAGSQGLPEGAGDLQAAVVRDAVALRLAVALERGSRELRKRGVRSVAPHKVAVRR